MAEINLSPVTAEYEAIQRRRKMAEALMQQGQQELPVNQMAGGYVVPVSPYAGLAKMLQTGLGGWMTNKTDRDVKELSTQREGAQKADMSALIGALQNTSPGRPEIPMPDPSIGGMGPDRPSRPATGLLAPGFAEGMQTPEGRAQALQLMIQRLAPKDPIKVSDTDTLLHPTTYEVLRQGQPKQKFGQPRYELIDGVSHAVVYDEQGNRKVIGPASEQNTFTAGTVDAELNRRQKQQEWENLSAAERENLRIRAQQLGISIEELFFNTGIRMPSPPLSPPGAPPPGGTGTTLDLNNPGGLRPVGASTGFQQFKTPEEGINGIVGNLRAYGDKGINTIEKIVSTWAPPNENNTRAYIDHVSRILGVPAGQPLDMKNPYVLQALTTAIMTKEQGPRLFASPAAAPAAGGVKLTPKSEQEAELQARRGGQFGPPQEVTGPDGKPMLVVQNKITGFMHDANTQQPVAVAGPKLDSATHKELTSINQQRATIDGALAAVKQTPSAFSFARGTATRAGSSSESIAGRFDSPKESEARSYVFNIVSKVINERAGAAQSAQELQRLRSFLPAEQDNAEQITNKLNGFKTYLADLEKGTTPNRQGGGALPPPPPGAVRRVN
jgi:hypothetical protein